MERQRITESDVVRAAQAVQRDRHELLALLGDVSDSVVGHGKDGAAIAHLSPPLVAAIRRRTNTNEKKGEPRV